MTEQSVPALDVVVKLLVELAQILQVLHVQFFALALDEIPHKSNEKQANGIVDESNRPLLSKTSISSTQKYARLQTCGDEAVTPVKRGEQRAAQTHDASDTMRPTLVLSRKQYLRNVSDEVNSGISRRSGEDLRGTFSNAFREILAEELNILIQVQLAQNTKAEAMHDIPNSIDGAGLQCSQRF